MAGKKRFEEAQADLRTISEIGPCDESEPCVRGDAARMGGWRDVSGQLLIQG